MKLIPFVELRQVFNYDCGSCAVVCCLASYDINVREDFVIQVAGTSQEGTNTAGIIKVFDYFGLRTRSGKMTVRDLRHAIDRGFPTIITLQAYGDPKNYATGYEDGHYVVAIGYSRRRIYFEDPSAYQRTFLGDQELLSRWHDIDQDNEKVINWGCTILKKTTFRTNHCIHMD